MIRVRPLSRPIDIHYDSRTLEGFIDRYVTMKDGVATGSGVLPWAEPRDWQSYYTADAAAAVDELPEEVKDTLREDLPKFDLIVTFPAAVDELVHDYARTGEMPRRVTSYINGYPLAIRRAYMKWIKTYAESEMLHRGPRTDSIHDAGEMNPHDKIMLISPVMSTETENHGIVRYEFGAVKSTRWIIYHEIAHRMFRLYAGTIKSFSGALEHARRLDLENLGISESGGRFFWQPKSEFAGRLQRLLSFRRGGNAFSYIMQDHELPIDLWAHRRMANQNKAETTGNMMLAAFPISSAKMEIVDRALSIPDDPATIERARKRGQEFIMSCDLDSPRIQRDPMQRLLRVPEDALRS